MGFDGFDTLDALKFLTVALIASTATIASLARARRENAMFWGGVCAGGFLLLPVLVMFVLVPKFMDATFARERRPFWFVVSTVLWVGGLALYLRFFAGRKRTQPDGMWTCPNCTFLNKEYELACEACSQPYSKPAHRS
jgi:hypothetical protein